MSEPATKNDIRRLELKIDVLADAIKLVVERQGVNEALERVFERWPDTMPAPPPGE